ncbi:hypothetical protein H920_00976 [Fukomys damarensis]|uniref:Uncharacterized protein n=1 Tax=Fukomys damarensis TaxID=885580 RepID=A0A091E4Y3_FUKDA|nr:hypothetical protein H920_00976 [Fukomys damarensis]
MYALRSLYNMAMTSATYHAIITPHNLEPLLNGNVNRAPNIPRSPVVINSHLSDFSCPVDLSGAESMIQRPSSQLSALQAVVSAAFYNMDVSGGPHHYHMDWTPYNMEVSNAPPAPATYVTCGALHTVIVSRASHVLMTSGIGGALDSTNGSTALPHTDHPKYVWCCYNEGVSRPHIPWTPASTFELLQGEHKQGSSLSVTCGALYVGDRTGAPTPSDHLGSVENLCNMVVTRDMHLRSVDDFCNDDESHPQVHNKTLMPMCGAVFNLNTAKAPNLWTMAGVCGGIYYVIVDRSPHTHLDLTTEGHGRMPNV